jgi:two-component system cell cycle sensor histidine kinase/response regulator CckA
LNPAKILIVDDQIHALKGVSRIMTSAGYDTFEANNGEDCLKLAVEHKPDLILLDVVLPDIDGKEVCRRIKSNPETADIYVVLVSGIKTESDSQAEGLEYGADGYIAKPIPNRELLARVKAMLRLKAAEGRLREREKNFEAITDVVHDAIIQIDDKGEISFWNPASERLFGYKSSEVIGKNVHELLAPPKYQTAFRSAFKDFAVSGKGNAVGKITELEARRKGGEEFPIELSLSAFQMDGRWHAAGIVRDISERKKTEEALEESERKYRLLADNTKDVIWQADMDLRFTYVNPAVEQVTGYTQDEWIGTRLAEHCDEENFLKMAQVLSAEMSKGSGSKGATFEAVLLNKTREPVPVEISGKIIYGENGFPIALQGTTREISDRKNFEKALLESEFRYRSLFESSRDGIVFTDMEGSIKGFNTAYREMLGYTEEELFSTTYHDLTPTEWEAIEDRIVTEQIIPRGYSDVYEKEYICKDGRVIPVELTTFIVKRDGENVGMWATVRDISERKQLEKERLEIGEKLYHARKLESLGVMAGGIAHDFNNLLMVVLGNLDMVLDDLPLDSETRQSVENAIKAAERSAELSTQMLTYTGRTLYHSVDLDLNQLLDKNRDLLKLGVSDHVTLNLELGDTLPHIKGDADQLHRLVMNILVNASEAIGDQDGYVTIRTGVMDCDEARLDRSLLDAKSEHGRFVFLEVTDTGCGMELEVQRKLFDPFFTTKFVGRGLGMAETLGIVTGHHGAIRVDSEIGKGTTIRVLFPPSEQIEAPFVKVNDEGETESPLPNPVHLRKTILVVDDEELVRGMVVRRLQVLGYDTIEAFDGREGVSVFKARSNEIDLVLLDFAMPRMNGIEAFGELIRIKPDVKVILCSGYTEDVVLDGFPGQRPSGVLHKPYKMEILKDELERLLGATDSDASKDVTS